MIEFKGITWDHARGYDPMVATAKAYSAAHPNVHIEWKKRSLKEFGDYPIQKLAETFDLLVIDHPFVGFAADDGCLIPLDEHISADFLQDQAANSVGKSHISYNYNEHQWALAIDAAGQISAYRADLLEKTGETVPRTWDEVRKLARKLKSSGKHWVALPICPIDAFMSLYSIAASSGEAPCSTPDLFLSRAVGRYALGMLVELAELVHPECINWNPIMTFNAMSGTDEAVYCPLLFGYSNYGRGGFAPNLISFTNVPAENDIPRGAILGGTGIAISKHCQNLREACDYATFVASREVQSTLYFQSGGQPGHRSAWVNEQVNAASNDFFKNTLATLDNSYLRPRYNGYMGFQEESWYQLHDFLIHGGDHDAMLDKLDNLYRNSFTKN